MTSQQTSTSTSWTTISGGSLCSCKTRWRCVDIHFWKLVHIPIVLLLALDIQRCHALFLSFNPLSRDHHPCYGPYWWNPHQQLSWSQVWTVNLCCSQNITKETLNKYYNATDQSEVYHIAMGMCFPTAPHGAHHYCLPCFSVLHPCHKLQYFEHTGWQPDWIKTAEEIVRAKFEELYAALADDDVDMLLPVSTKKVYWSIWSLTIWFLFIYRYMTFSMTCLHLLHPGLRNSVMS